MAILLILSGGETVKEDEIARRNEKRGRQAAARQDKSVKRRREGKRGRKRKLRRVSENGTGGILREGVS